MKISDKFHKKIQLGVYGIIFEGIFQENLLKEDKTLDPPTTFSEKSGEGVDKIF